MQDLIERLEKVAHPDVRLDWEIHRTLGNEHVLIDDYPVWRSAGLQWPATADSVPNYTGSIDAAMSLMPSGAVGFAGTDFELPGNAHINDGHQNYNAQGANPAIAFCIAALRARGTNRAAAA